MEDPSLLQLTERLLTLPGSGGAQILVGQLPEHWPSTVPLIEDTQLVGSVTFSNRVQVVLETRLSPEQVLAAYYTGLTSQGAQVLPSSTTTGIEASRLSRFQLPEQDGNLVVEAFTLTDETDTDVRLNWLPIDSCNEIQRQRSSFNQVSQIPLLMPPLDAPSRYLGIANCKDADARGQFALFRATVTDNASDVLEHFAQQLASASWQRIAQTDTCITWRIPRAGGANEAWGALWVLEWPGRDHQKMIMVRAEP